MRPLQGAKLDQEPIVIGIGDHRIVKHVIAKIVGIDLIDQLGVPLLRRHEGHLAA
jgi:hypothetical protein